MLIRVLVVVLIIAALAMSGIFYKDHLDYSAVAEEQTRQIAGTQSNIVAIEEKTGQVEVELEDLVRQYSSTRTSIDFERSRLPARMNPNEIVKSVMLLGDQVNVTVIPLSTREWVRVRFGQSDYSVFGMHIEVNGAESDIVRFLERLQTSLYQTLTIESISLKKTTEVIVEEEPEETTTTIITTSADVNLAIYAR